MIVSDKIYINVKMAQKLDPRIFTELTYPNPEYYQKINMGFSVWGVPETIKTFKVIGKEVQIMRGEALKIKPYFGDSWAPDFMHPNHPINIQYINKDFDLDQYQEGAIEAMKATRQGLIHAVTSAGKSLIICKAIAEIGQRALIVVHRKILMEQLLKDIDKYIRDENGKKIKVGIIGAGSCTAGDITIGIDKTLSKHTKTIRQSFGVVVLDECHLAPAKTISNLINGINAKHRYGLTGTLRRKDQKEFLIYSTFGQVIYTIGKEELLDMDRVVPVEIKTIETETRFDWDQVVTALEEQGDKNPTSKARHLQEQTIAGDPARRDIVIDQVKRLYDQGHKVMVLSRYVAPCLELAEQLEARFNVKAGVITGKDAKRAVADYRAMKEADLKVIFATIGCVATGVSISDLNDIVLISPVYNNELLLHQIRGRLMRTAEGKTHGTLWFLYDQYIFRPSQLRKFKRIMES